MKINAPWNVKMQFLSILWGRSHFLYHSHVAKSILLKCLESVPEEVDENLVRNTGNIKLAQRNINSPLHVWSIRTGKDITCVVVTRCLALRRDVLTNLFLTGTKHLGEKNYKRKNLSRLTASGRQGRSITWLLGFIPLDWTSGQKNTCEKIFISW